MAGKLSIGIGANLAPLKTAIEETFGILSKFATTMGDEGKKMQAEISAASKKVNAELAGISKEYKNNAEAATGATKKSGEGFVNLRTQLRNAKQELQQTSEQFGAFSKEALAAAEKVGHLRDKQDELKEVADAFDPRTKMKAVADLAGAAAGGMGILAGGMAALGISSENSQETIQRLMGLMTAMQGITAIEGLVGTFNTLKASVMANIAAQGALKTAMIATGIGALVVAVGALVANWDAIVGGIKDFLGIAPSAAAAQEKLAETAERESKAIEATVKARQAHWNALFMLQELAIKATQSGVEEEVQLRKLALKKDMEGMYQQAIEKKITMAQYFEAVRNMQKITNDDVAELYKKDRDEHAAKQAEKTKKVQEQVEKRRKAEEEASKKVVDDFIAQTAAQNELAAAQVEEKEYNESVTTAMFEREGSKRVAAAYKNAANELSISMNLTQAEREQMEERNRLWQKGQAQQKIYTDTASAMNKAFADETRKLMGEVAANMGQMLGEALVTGDLSITDLFQSIMNSVAGFMQSLGKQFISIGLAQTAIELGLSTMNPAVSIAAGTALVAAGAAAKKIMSNGIKPMAAGGILSGPQMILAGEYSSARSNPEVIAPLDKLKNLIGGDGGRVQVQGVMGGRDIYFTNQQYSRINKRITGR